MPRTATKVKRTTARKTTTSRAKATTKTKAVTRKSAGTKATATRTRSLAATKSKTVSRVRKTVPNTAFMAPMQPDAELAAVVGKKPIPRTQVTKKVWAYIKKHDLQDATHRRVIVADEKLRPIFGNRRRVDMFQMTKLINQHLADID